MPDRAFLMRIALGAVAAAAVLAAAADPPPAPAEGDDDSAATQPHKKPLLAPEQEEELLEFLRDKSPERHEHLLSLREADERAYRRTARALYLFMRRVKALPAHVQGPYIEMTDLTVEMWKRAQALRDLTDPQEKARHLAELRELAARRFDAEQVVREHRIAQLEEEIAHLRQQWKERSANRRQAIEESVSRFLRPATKPSSPEASASQPGRPARASTQPAAAAAGE